MIPRSKSMAAMLMLGVLMLASPALCPSKAVAQSEQQKDDPETAAKRRRALDFYRQGRYVDALPLLEELSISHPNDFVLKEHWAYCMLEYSATLGDPEKRKQARLQARNTALEAQRLGDQSDLLQVLLSIPADGAEAKFSDRADVNEGMKTAEAEFARGNLDKARDGYKHVLELDPNNYDATLFVGDVYFKEHAYNSAGEWFGKAVKMNPARETAYRYWGDALASAGKNDEAREKYIGAVIAEPYNRAPWAALRTWADRVKQPFNAIILQNKSSVTKKDKEVVITLDEHSLKSGDPEMAGWLAYSGVRATWQSEKFKKEFPNEPTYRRSLKEETEALHTMVEVLAPEAASKKTAEKLDPTLLELVQIDHEGLLQSFVLLNRADPEIAKDYPAYRDAHPDKLYRYVDEFVLPKTGASTTK